MIRKEWKERERTLQHISGVWFVCYKFFKAEHSNEPNHSLKPHNQSGCEIHIPGHSGPVSPGRFCSSEGKESVVFHRCSHIIRPFGGAHANPRARLWLGCFGFNINGTIDVWKWIRHTFGEYVNPGGFVDIEQTFQICNVYGFVFDFVHLHTIVEANTGGIHCRSVQRKGTAGVRSVDVTSHIGLHFVFKQNVRIQFVTNIYFHLPGFCYRICTSRHLCHPHKSAPHPHPASKCNPARSVWLSGRLYFRFFYR